MEVVISIGLISIVMLFLFNILIDMQFERDHAAYAKDNQLNRAIIIKRVQTDFMEKGLKNIEKQTLGDLVQLRFIFDDNSSKNLVVGKDYITYDGEKWLIKASNNTTFYDKDHISMDFTPSNTCTYQLNIDTDGDGVCNANCDTNKNGVLDASEFGTKNETYKVCSNYTYFKAKIPVVTGEDDNVIDDIEFFYVGVKE